MSLTRGGRRLFPLNFRAGLLIAFVSGSFFACFCTGESLTAQSPPPSQTKAPIERPQNPKRPFPYLEEEVTVVNAAQHVTLAGTLTKPGGTGPFPVVLLITGSGPQDRDETLPLGGLPYHKPFLIISDYLTRRRIAVLRLDDRGIAKSTGQFETATTADFATDIQAGVEFLSKRPDIDRRHIGLIGHSEGGVIVPMVANQDPHVSFVVLLAAPGVRGDRIIEQQVFYSVLAAGQSADDAQHSRDVQHRLFEIVEATPDQAEQDHQVDEFMAGDKEVAGQIKSALPMLNKPWYRYFAAYDPGPALERLKIPVLVLHGAKDTQVDPMQNMPANQAALARGKNPDATVRVVPGVNHLFQDCSTGYFAEYATIDETISPAVLDIIGDWIEMHVK
jgi:uncharacterized protein